MSRKGSFRAICFGLLMQAVCLQSYGGKYDSPSADYRPSHGGYPVYDKVNERHDSTGDRQSLKKGHQDLRVHTDYSSTAFEVHITPDQDIHLDPNRPTIFVTHLDKASPDESHGTILEAALSKLLNRAKEDHLDVVASRWWKKNDFYFDPYLITYWALNTRGGNFSKNLKVTSSRAIVTGGQFVYCASGTVNSILESWANQGLDGKLVLLLPAMYDRAQNSKWPNGVREKAEAAGDDGFMSTAEILDRYFVSNEERFNFLKLMTEAYLNPGFASFKTSPLKDYDVFLSYRAQTYLAYSRNTNDLWWPFSRLVKLEHHTVTIQVIHPNSYDDQSLEAAVTDALNSPDKG